MHLDRLQVDAGAVEVAQQALHRPAGAGHPAADVLAVDLDLAADVADPSQLARRLGDPVRVDQLEVDEVAGDLRP